MSDFQIKKPDATKYDINLPFSSGILATLDDVQTALYVHTYTFTVYGPTPYQISPGKYEGYPKISFKIKTLSTKNSNKTFTSSQARDFLRDYYNKKTNGIGNNEIVLLNGHMQGYNGTSINAQTSLYGFSITNSYRCTFYYFNDNIERTIYTMDISEFDVRSVATVFQQTEVAYCKHTCELLNTTNLFY